MDCLFKFLSILVMFLVCDIVMVLPSAVDVKILVSYFWACGNRFYKSKGWELRYVVFLLLKNLWYFETFLCNVLFTHNCCMLCRVAFGASHALIPVNKQQNHPKDIYSTFTLHVPTHMIQKTVLKILPKDLQSDIKFTWINKPCNLHSDTALLKDFSDN